MFERFTAAARHVVVLAQEEARKLGHNYIGTEHILLGLLGEPEGVAHTVLAGLGMSVDSAREEVAGLVGAGSGKAKGHIPFTPRAKKTLELALREALQLHHDYIGTEHILLGLIREGEGVAAQLLKEHADLPAIRAQVLDLAPSPSPEATRIRRWLRRYAAPVTREVGEPGAAGKPGSPEHQAVLNATPAVDATLSEAARLAGNQLVGSHHLLLAALSDPDTAAARALAAAGVELDQAREALRAVAVAGTSDEPPEEAGRRQMVIRVTDDRITVEATDPVILQAGQAALRTLGDQASPTGEIRGDLPVCASLTRLWQALHDGLRAIEQRTIPPAEYANDPEKPAGPGAEVA